jgi:hypothetical protein
MTMTDYVKPDSKALTPVNTPVAVLGTAISKTNGSRTPHPSSDHACQTLLNEVNLRLERLSLETVSLETEEIEGQ